MEEEEKPKNAMVTEVLSFPLKIVCSSIVVVRMSQ